MNCDAYTHAQLVLHFNLMFSDESWWLLGIGKVSPIFLPRILSSNCRSGWIPRRNPTLTNQIFRSQITLLAWLSYFKGRRIWKNSEKSSAINLWPGIHAHAALHRWKRFCKIESYWTMIFLHTELSLSNVNVIPFQSSFATCSLHCSCSSCSISQLFSSVSALLDHCSPILPLIKNCFPFLHHRRRRFSWLRRSTKQSQHPFA